MKFPSKVKALGWKLAALISLFWIGYSGCNALCSDSIVDSPPKQIPLVLDEGRVTRLFLSWTTDGKPCLSEEDLRSIDETYQGYFLKHAKRYSPCLMTHALYNGNVAQLGDLALCPSDDGNFRQLLSKSKRVFEKYKETVLIEEWSSWLVQNQPLSVGFSKVRTEKSEVEIGSGLLERLQSVASVVTHAGYRSLEPVFSRDSVLVRWESLVQETPFDNHELVVEKSEGGFFELENSSGINSSVTKADRDSLLRWNFEFQQRQEERMNQRILEEFDKKYTHNDAKSVAIDLAKVCGCMSNELDCLDSCKQQILTLTRSVYLQDAYHARSGDNGSLLNSNDLSNPPVLRSANYLSQLCANVGSTLDPLRGIDGGNIIVLKNNLFIGMDELDSLLNSSSRRDILKHGLPKDTLKIENALLMAVYGDTLNRNLVWVGNSSKVQRYDFDAESMKEHSQPIFHIDLFFQPLGYLNPDSVFYVVIALPDTLIPFTSQNIMDRHYYQRASIRSLQKELLDKLKPLEDSVACIEVPLFMEWNGNSKISNYSNFLNGIFENSEGEMTFLEPVFKNETTAINTQRRAFNKALLSGIPENVKLNVEPVHGTYGNRAGLRCQVKVLSRD